MIRVEKWIYTVALLAALLAAFGADKVAAAECGECMPNLAHCINETHFYLCPDGKVALTSTAHSCASGKICTSADGICVEREQAEERTIVCRNECDRCAATSPPNNKMTCVSATQYAVCSDGQPTKLVGFCGRGEHCNLELYRKHGRICAPKCVLEFFNYRETCGNEVVTTTSAPTIPTVEPQAQDLRKQCTDSKPKPYKGYFYVRNVEDPNCKTYLYCEEISGEMQFVLYDCRSEFYDENAKKCVSVRPQNCEAAISETAEREFKESAHK